jgi:hypothetical protein
MRDCLAPIVAAPALPLDTRVAILAGDGSVVATGRLALYRDGPAGEDETGRRFYVVTDDGALRGGLAASQLQPTEGI